MTKSPHLNSNSNNKRERSFEQKDNTSNLREDISPVAIECPGVIQDRDILLKRAVRTFRSRSELLDLPKQLGSTRDLRDQAGVIMNKQ